MTITAKITACIAVLLLALSSCDEDKQFPARPYLEYRSFSYDDEGAFLKLYFTDGDGDIGFEPQDTLPPYDFVYMPGDEDSTRSLNQFHYNLIVMYEEYSEGEWVTFDDLDTPWFRYRITNLTPEGQDKALEGEISVDLATPVPYLTSSASNDSVRYLVTLIDRALNESNPVYSPLILFD